MLVGNLMPCETIRGGVRGRKHGSFTRKNGYRYTRGNGAKRFTLKGWRALWGYRTTEVDSCQSLFHIESARFLVMR